ncbi:50S ribosomal protein L28 [Rubrobacter taiwanensis]|jgi:large subunit ribosomal protein L28|uniref:Large ribosomal subunit protein bL28 n=1 Tax=Rubrobacter taiwanensis TaxID=185139 RepID=A0A4R1BHB1_9ACTN|nr:50S ribosomal protein L28 [Rubrobacter taiwanensis]TCJ16666.1 50S ribosomal protein L28 [Rubrobacter taiwanensis]
MAKVCYSCGKGPGFGNARSHSLRATRRRWNPNLQRVRIQEGSSTRRVYVCTSCLKAFKVQKAALKQRPEPAGL